MSGRETPAPQNLDAEESVLGAMMLSPAAIAKVREDLDADAFYRESHGKIYRAALELDGRGDPVDAITLADELKKRGEIDEVGGRGRIHELAALVPATANVAHYAKIVRECARRREEAAIGREILAASDNGGLPAHPDVRERVRAALDVDSGAQGLSTRGVLIERVRPIRWLWARRIPLGLPSILVGEEGIGKGTLAAWLIAKATRGELEGDLKGEPIRVLIIGDEDSFEPLWVPRLCAAGVDLKMLRTLDDGEYLEDLEASADRLALTVQRERIGLLLFDQLLDHVPGGANGEAIYNPKNVRRAMLPLRRVAGEQDVAALGLLHPIKGNVSSFRQLVAGSHQFNAVSRSSLLLAADPEDEARRVLVRGKGNHSAAPRSFEFRIAGEVVDLNKHHFEVPRVVGEAEGDRTVQDLLKAGPPDAPVRDELAEQLVERLTDEPQALADLARVVGRERTDGSVRRALDKLATDGRAEKVEGGKWIRPGQRASATPKGDGTARPEPTPSEAELQRLLDDHSDIAQGNGKP